MNPAAPAPKVEARARQSAGISEAAVYRLVAETLAGRHPAGGTLIDLGCGRGDLWPFLRERFDRYIGVDAVRYQGFPADGEFHPLDLDVGRAPLPDGAADVVVAAETIEHVENPRALMREVVRLCKTDGWIVVTTPNQLSLLSKLTLVVKNQFNAFQDSCYPAHLTALLEVDLRRMAAECDLQDVAVRYSGQGRMPGTSRRWPGWLSHWAPRAFSDGVAVVGRRGSDS